MTSKIKGDIGIEFPDGSVQSTAADAGPAFKATGVGGMTVNTTAKITTISTVVFDTANCYANSRFTPNVAGYYQVQGFVGGDSLGTAFVFPAIYKNGVDNRSCQSGAGNGQAGNFWAANVVDLVYLNGTTDYVELWATVIGSPIMNTCAFSASLVRRAAP